MAGTLNDVYSISESGAMSTALTTNATVQTTREYQVSPFEGGFLTVTVTAADKSGNFMNGEKGVRYKKDSTGVLTLGTVVNIIPIQADTAISTATFNIISQNQNIAIQVTGVAGISIGWTIVVNRQATSMNNF